MAAFSVRSGSLPAAEDEFIARRLDNWHQWRGPEGNGVAPRGDPPLRWSEGENVRWKVEIPGEGHFTQSNSAILSCVEARTGKALINGERLPGLKNLYASPAGAAGRVYFVDRDGTTLVIRHGVKLEVLATNRFDDAIDASPAIAGRQILLRGRQHLYCLEAAEAPAGEAPERAPGKSF